MLSSVVSKHPLTCFVIATYALSWWSVPFANGAIIPYGPFIAAIIILSITRGRAGLSELFRRMTLGRGKWGWLLIGPGLVVAYLTLALAAHLLLGGTISQTSHLSSLGAPFLSLLLLGGMWEEPGWTGFALPLLQERHADRPFGLLKASLIMGLIRAGWHLPLMISGAIPWFDVLFLSMAFQFLIAWLFNRSGSVLPPMLFHLTSNIIGGAIMLPLFIGSDRDTYYVLFIVAASLLAIALNMPRAWSMGRVRNAA